MVVPLSMNKQLISWKEVVTVVAQPKFQRKILLNCVRPFKHFPDSFLMTQIKAMDGGLVSTSRHLKKKIRSNKKTYYC